MPVMLRIHGMQLFYNLSDSAMEDALCEIESMHHFADVSLNKPVPDETTILKFRYMLEAHNLGKALFDPTNKHMTKEELSLKEETIVDVTFIRAPTSTKNRTSKCDPEMNRTK